MLKEETAAIKWAKRLVAVLDDPDEGPKTSAIHLAALLKLLDKQSALIDLLQSQISYPPVA